MTTLIGHRDSDYQITSEQDIHVNESEDETSNTATLGYDSNTVANSATMGEQHWNTGLDAKLTLVP